MDPDERMSIKRREGSSHVEESCPDRGQSRGVVDCGRLWSGYCRQHSIHLLLMVKSWAALNMRRWLQGQEGRGLPVCTRCWARRWPIKATNWFEESRVHLNVGVA